MRKIILSWILLLLGFATIAQNATIKGKITDADGSPVADAIVSIVGTNLATTSDGNGNFAFENLKAGEYQIFVGAENFQDYFSETIKLTNNEEKNLEIKLTPTETNIDESGVTVVNADDLNDELGSENISSMLHGSRDAFLNAAAYALGPMRFKIRGYDNHFTQILINGVDMANLETGNTYWSNWGGLNNVTRYKNTTVGLNASDVTFGNVGGSTDIQMQPSAFRSGSRITYSLANRSYRNRVMFTYSTGLLKNNWAFTISGSHRWANEGYVEGTFYDSWAYYVGIEKKTNKHDIILNVFASPTKRGKQGASVQEAYDLVNNVYYNPYWGYQNGKKRDSRVANLNQPVAIFTDIWTINNTLKLQTSAAVRAGRNGSTALNWYNAPDPRPDYYRYLPSYITNEEEAAIVADSFASNPEYSQINWAELYEANRNSYETIHDVDGISGNDISGKRAQYIVEERRYDQVYGILTSNLTKQLNENLKLTGGLQYQYFVGKNFKVVNDLLGADFWVDIDKYAERDLGDPDSAQSDLNHPNRIVKEGDIFGYNYNSHIQTAKTWIQTVYDVKHFNIALAGFFSYTTMWREGKMRNGKFPDNSYGNSKKLNFPDYGGKLGIIYKINGRNFIQAHALYMTEAPIFRNVYISPRTRDNTINNPSSQIITSGDIGYAMRAPRLKITLNAFYTQFQNQTKVMSFYHDGYRNFVNYALTGIDKIHQGVEFAIDGKITSALSAYAVASFGYYRWTSRPQVTVTVDNSAEILAENKTVYVKNFLVAGTPQTAASAGLNYRSAKYWFFGANINYVDDIFLDFNPERRTSEAVEYVVPNSDLWQHIVYQTKLPSGYTIDASIGKSFRFQHKYYLSINLNVNNVLDNKKIITGGYEQLRYDVRDKNPDKFPPKFYYLYGRQFFLNVSFSF